MEKMNNGIRIGILVAGLLVSVSAGAHAAVSVIAHSSATFHSGHYDQQNGMATDSYGNVFIVGRTGVSGDYLTVKYNNALTFISSATYNGGNADEAWAVAVDTSGNVFVTGTREYDENDIYTIKYDNDLHVRATAVFDRAGTSDMPRGIAVNAAGEVLVTGMSGTQLLTLKYGNDLAAGPTCYYYSASSEGYGITTDNAGNVFVAGSISGSSWDIFLVKLDNDLVFLSSATYDSAGRSESGEGIAIDQAGNVFVSGRVDDGEYGLAVKFGPDLAVISADLQTSPAGGDASEPVRLAMDTLGNLYTAMTFEDSPASFMHMVKYDNDLQVVSTVAFPLSGSGYASCVAVDHAGNAFLSGGNSNGSSIDTVTLKFLPAPSALMISPNSGPIAGGTAVTIDGGGFVSGAAVSIGGRAATDVVFVSSTQITAKTSSSASAGPFEFTVTNPDGQVTPLAGYFTYVGPTVVNSTSTVINAATGGTVTLSPVYGDLSVDIPAGAFSEDVTVTVSTTAVPGSGQSAIRTTGIGIEVTNGAGLQPNKEIVITVYYRDADIAGLEESKLSLARYESGRWIPIPTVVYADQNKLVGTVKHLSTFAVVQFAPAADLAGVRVYPNPFNPKNGSLTLANLTGEADIKIYNVAGELVRTLSYTSADGQAVWDGKNDGGNSVASGIYLAFIKSPQGKKIIKIAVEK